MIKTLKKVLAVVLTLTMLLSIVSVPVSADTFDYNSINGKTIDLSIIVSSDNKGNYPITSVNAGDTFYMIVNFSGNPTDLESTIAAYCLLFSYNPDKIAISSKLNGLTAPTFNPEFAEGVFLGAWASLDGILNEDSEITSEGKLFRVKATALTDLVEDDLAKIKPIESAIGGTGETQETRIYDVNNDSFTINWVPTLQEEIIPDPIEIRASDFAVDLSDKEYAGVAIRPCVSSHIPEEAYTVTYGENTECGTATITISLNNPDEEGYVWVGAQRYCGEDIVFEFNIVEKAIDEFDFDLSAIKNSEYTGVPIEPDVVSITGLVKGIDYEVTYTDNVNVGTAAVTVTAIGNYAGTITKTFRIVARTIREDDFIFDIDPEGYEFEGAPVYPEVTPVTGLVFEQDYVVTYSNNMGPGRVGKITVKGIGNYTGTISKTFNIKAEALVVSGMIGLGIGFTSTYDPEAKISNVKAGDKFVMWVNIEGNPTESADVTIAAYDLLLQYDNDKIKLRSYENASTKPEVNLCFNEDTVMASWADTKGITSGMPAKLQSEATLFAIEAEAKEDLDVAELKEIIRYVEEATSTDGNTQSTAFMSRNLMCQYVVCMMNTLFDIADCVAVSTDSYEYTGKAIIPAMYHYGDVTDADYELSYEPDNINVGTVTVTVTGKGNYYGSFTTTFEIIEPSTFDDIKLSIAFTKADGGNDNITSVASGEKFWMWVNFANNSTELEDTAIAYDLLIAYNKDKIKLDNCYDALTNPTVNLKFNDRTAFAQWASTDGIESGMPAKIQSEGTLFVIEATAKETLSAGDLRDIIVIDQAQGQLGTVTRYKETCFYDINENIIDYIFESTIEGGKEIKESDFTFDLADKVYTGSAIEPAVTSTLVAGTDYEVVYSNNVEIGTATITIRGLGNYVGTITKTFKIIDPSVIDEIILSIAFTNVDDDNKITSVAEGQKFWMWVNFANNSTELEDTAIAYDLLIAYNKDKITLNDYYDYLTSPTANLKFTDGVVFAQWASTDGIKSGIPAKIQSEGTLFVIEATAKEALSARDLRDIIVIDQAQGQLGTVTRYKETRFYDINENIIDYIFESTVEESTTIEIKESDFIIDISDKEYTGNHIEPEVSSEKLVKDKDYIVVYAYNIDVGTATITIKGMGDYVGMIQKLFRIVPKPITKSKFTIDTSSKVYTGSKFEPSVTSSLPSDAYEVSYSNNIEVGTATITIEGRGNYTGTVTETFTIVAKAITDSDFEFDLADKTYTGEEIKPEVKSALIAGIDYEVRYLYNIEVGTATIVVTAKCANYSGSITKTFKIVPKAIQEYDFEFDLENKTFTGSEIQPEVVSESLVEGTDYYVAYSNNTNAGTAEITVTGRGNYSGMITKTFIIVPRAIAYGDFVFDLTDKEYTGSAIESAVTSELVAGTDYEIVYADNTNTGIATITVTGLGNYAGTIVTTFNIIAKAISDTDFTFDLADKVYTGSAIEPIVISTLAADDYEVTYADNTNAGAATIIVKGIGNYTGMITKSFTIIPKPIIAEDFTLAETQMVYTGAALAPDVISTLVYGTDFDVTYENNVNVGTTTVIITGCGNYTGEIVLTFDIVPQEIIDTFFTVKLAVEYKDGEVITHDNVADLFVTDLVVGEDFEVAYYNNVNVGTATIEFTGINNFKGTITKTFEILAKAITDSDFTFELADKAYTGSAIYPEVTSELIVDRNYDVSYANNTNVGTATITVVGKGNYKGTIVKTFTIVPAFICESDFDFTAIVDAEYTGSAIEPVVSAFALEESADYDVAYDNNINVGTATVTVTAKGNYIGIIVKAFDILPKAITESDIVFDLDDKTYTGSEIMPEYASALVEGVDYDVSYYNNLNVGTATIIVAGMGNYTGEITLNFSIVAKEITNDDFVLAETQVVYTGSEIKPAIISDLLAGTDYEVVYENNIEVGTATVVVTAMGNYTGELVLNFEIIPKSIEDSDFTFDLDDKEYTGSAIEPGVVSTLADIDYEVVYADNTNAGTATVTVVGKGNYTGEIVKTFRIAAKAICEADFTFDVDDKEYTGSAIEPEVTSTLADGDYVVTYENNVEPGMATITVTASGVNCVGTIVKNFKIISKTIAESDFTFDLTDKMYTGSAIEPAVTSTLVAGTDYKVTYTNNVNTGTATITVKGLGSYTGTITKTFEIKGKVIVDSYFTFVLDNVEYTGSAIEPEVTSTLAATDYTVTYINNVNAGTATIAVAGTGNYTGTITKTFKITAISITRDDFTFYVDENGYEFEGVAIRPRVTSTLAATDYQVTYVDNAKVGIATIVVEGRGNYTGTIEKAFTIKAKYIPENDFTFDLSDQKYTGEPIKPIVTSDKLVEGVDYDVVYYDNIEIGVATIVVVCYGDYKGAIVKKFNIKAKVYQPASGDVDGGGTVDIYDAIDVLKIVAANGEYTDDQKVAADIDRDGVVTIFDIIDILKMVAGLI